MEFVSEGIEQQRTEAMEAARFALDNVFYALSQMPKSAREFNLINIAWGAANDGTWHELGNYMDEDIEAMFIPETTSERQRWIEQFAAGQDYDMAEHLIETLPTMESKIEAGLAVARKAADKGDSGEVFDFSADSAEPRHTEKRMLAVSSLFSTLAAKGLWRMAEEIAAREPIATYNLLVAATAAAEQAEYDSYVMLANKAIAQDPVAEEGRGSIDTGDWLERPTVQAAETAFAKGDFNFLVQMGTLVAWPEDAEDVWPSWVKSGIIRGIYDSQEFEEGINIFITWALEGGEDTAIHNRAQVALDERNWQTLTLLAPYLNPGVVGLLHRLAYKEGNMTAAQKLIECKRHSERLQGHANELADDASYTMLEEAKKKNWRLAMRLRPATTHAFARRYTQQLIDIAVAQEYFGMLPTLVGDSEQLLFRASDTLKLRGKYDTAKNLVNNWLEMYPKAGDDLTWFKFGFEESTAMIAASQSDWHLAIAAAQAMDGLMRSQRTNHRGYEYVALEALKVLRSAKR